ncbi:hypothetical protein BC833DRAFT_620376 [Globomyces pollinis-pini]|nr:hypothetical protein BC833DRAFT_620376 [Globomyces pollinis-pini]
MSGYNEFKTVIKENLLQRGVISKLEARLRAEIFESLNNGYDSIPAASKPTRIVNELIREYLVFNGYGHSASVFQAEANLSKSVPDRSDLLEDLNINNRVYDNNVPLLYGLALKNQVTMVNEEEYQSKEMNETQVFSGTGEFYLRNERNRKNLQD